MVIHRPVRRGGGGFEGVRTNPPFLAGYTYYLYDKPTLHDGLSSKDDGWRTATDRV